MSPSAEKIDVALSLVTEVRREFAKREERQDARLRERVATAMREGIQPDIFAADEYERSAWLGSLRIRLECAETSLGAFLKSMQEV